MKYFFLIFFISTYSFANNDIFNAIQNKNTSALKAIVQSKPDAVLEVQNDNTTYMAACASDFENALFYLKDANINAVNQKGYSALMICSMLGNAQMTGKMAQMGANVNLQNNQGKSALMLAAFYGNTSTVQILLKNGANKNLTDAQGWKAVDFAKAKNKKDAIRLLNN